MANAAAAIWSTYLTAANVTLDLALIIDNSLFSGNTLAEGGPAGFYATGALFGSERVYDTNTAIELRTGQDRNGAAADLHIGFTVNSIRNLLTFKTNDTAPVPSNRVDALSVFLHEIGHGLGFLSLEDDSSAASVYDTFIQNGVFTGANAEAAAGAPTGVPLESGSISHIAESGGFAADLMSPVISRGTNTHISALDLAVLRDIGVPLRSDGSGSRPDFAPVLVTSNVTAARNVALDLSSLFSVSDADGDAITRYQLWDATRDSASGYFTVNGVAQAAGTVIEISAAALGQTKFVTGTVSDNLQIRAFDGQLWSAADSELWSPFKVSLSNTRPVVTTANVSFAQGTAVALSSLFSVRDPDGDLITRYQIWDSNSDPASGHFSIDGVNQPAATAINITAAQLSHTQFITGAGQDKLQIRAFDGQLWSASDGAAWSPFTVSLANRPPVVATGNVSAQRGDVIALSSLFSVSDPEGDTVTRYQLWDSTRDPASGHFVVNGVARAAGTVIDITAAQLAQTSFVAGRISDGIQIRAYDGKIWSADAAATWSPFTLSVPNTAPTLLTADITKGRYQTLALSSLFSISDADGDPISKYQLWDATRDAASGYFVVNGVVQAARTVIEITAAQLAQTTFVTGSVGDKVEIRGSDGGLWSAGDSTAWAPFSIDIPANHAPVVTTSDISARSNQTLSLASLFSVTDADADSVTRLQLWDSSRDPLSGHFVVNGVPQAPATVIDISASQLGQTSFVTGSTADILQIRAFDGMGWSAGDASSWSPFHVSIS